MFFSTPHYNLGRDDWVRFVSKAMSKPEGVTGPTSRMVHEIQNNHHVFTQITEDFETLLSKEDSLIGITNFLEENVPNESEDVVSNTVAARAFKLAMQLTVKPRH
jgi:hypothetical protein